MEALIHSVIKRRIADVAAYKKNVFGDLWDTCHTPLYLQLQLHIDWVCYIKQPLDDGSWHFKLGYLAYNALIEKSGLLITYEMTCARGDTFDDSFVKKLLMEMIRIEWKIVPTKEGVVAA